MENFFGITEEDIAEFTLSPEEHEAAVQESMDSARELAGQFLSTMKDPEWLERAHLIARLPGLESHVKTACIFLGLPHVLGQMFFIHAVATGQVDATRAVLIFTSYCQLINLPTYEISSWIAFFFGLGVLEQTDVTEAVTYEALQGSTFIAAGPMARILSKGTATNLNVMLETMLKLEKVLEEMGIVFTEDESLLAAEDVVDISSLAPEV